jgi:sulfate permease, SulP family
VIAPGLDRGAEIPAGTGRVGRRWRPGIGDAAGAVADLGVLVPLVAALVLVNGLDPGSVLLGAGILVVASGAAFGVPFPVQPLKALTAVAVAHRVGPDVIHAAGVEIGLFLLLLSVNRVADVISRIFTKTVVRALQLGVGALLVVTASKLALHPPSVFRGTLSSPWPIVLMLGAFAAVWFAARHRRYGLALLLLVVGTGTAWMAAGPHLTAPTISLPKVGLPPLTAWSTALVLLVIPQLPLTFGNAVVAVSDLAGEYFGRAASRVRPSTVCLSSGLGNLGSAFIGGMPMCHGSGGLTAHYRLGARSPAMNVLLGGFLVVAGLFFGPQVLTILGLLPVWALAAFLAYAGLQHAFLIQDLQGWRYGLALGAGAAGALLGNLAVTSALVIGVELSRSLVRLRR